MTNQTKADQAAKTGGSFAGFARILGDNIRQYGMLVSLIAIMIFFQFMTQGTLMKPVNLTNLILQNS